MRRLSGILGLGLGVLVLGLFSVKAFGLPFFLDSPARSNPHDSQHPGYQSPTPVATPTIPATAGPTPIPTTAGPTPIPTTAGPTPIPTPIPTVAAVPTYVWYDGDVAGSTLADGTGNASTNFLSAAIGMTEMAGAGPAGGTHFLDITFSAGANTGWGSAAYYHAGAPIDLTIYNTLTFYMKMPSNSCAIHDCFRPVVWLDNPNGYPADHSIAVTATAYVVGGGEATPDTWVKVEIPVSAFFGLNDKGVAIAPASISLTTGVTFAGWMYMYNMGAALYSELQVDKVVFEQRAPANIPTAGCVGLVLDDFENTQSNLWGGGPWQLEYGFDCTAQGLASTSITYPPGQPIVQGAMVPVTDNGGNVLSPCHAGHIAGSLGDTSVDCPAGSGNWSIADMRCYFSTEGWVTVQSKAINLTNNNYVRGLPVSGATGIKMAMKTTVHTGQVYQIQIVTTDSIGTGGWNHFYYQIGDSDAAGLIDNAWHTFSMDFPTGAAAAAGANPHSGSGTQQWWGQASGWGTMIPWTQNDFMQIKIRVINTGGFDLWVDDVSVY